MKKKFEKNEKIQKFTKNNLTSMKDIFLKVGLLVFIGVFSACNRESKLAPDEVEGYKPIYASKEQSNTINQLAPRPLEKPGKIYTYGNYLFVGEKSKGVHIFNNANPSNPVPLSFLEILGNNDIAIKNNFLYADNAGDLLVLNISNPNQITLVSRQKNVIPNSSSPLPPEEGFFECVDNQKGVVVAWEKTILRKPKCRR